MTGYQPPLKARKVDMTNKVNELLGKDWDKPTPPYHRFGKRYSKLVNSNIIDYNLVLPICYVIFAIGLAITLILSI